MRRINHKTAVCAVYFISQLNLERTIKSKHIIKLNKLYHFILFP